MISFNCIDIIKKFTDISSNKQDDISSLQKAVVENLKSVTQDTYKLLLNENNKSKSILSEIYVGEGCDAEQIWQQVRPYNINSIPRLSLKIPGLVSSAQDLLFEQFRDDINNSSKSDEAVDNSDDDQSSDNSSEYQDLNTENVINSKYETDEDDTDIEDEDNLDEEEEIFKEKKSKPSIVDDEFFKLNEMNEFLLNEEKKLENKNKAESDDEVDYFEEGSDFDESDDEGLSTKEKNPRFKDFFRKNDSLELRKRKLLESEDEEENAELVDTFAVEEPKSTLESIEERKAKKVKALENASIKEKDWYMKGEVRAEDRPFNSAIEEVLDFDVTKRPPPVFNNENNNTLEDIIKQRIKDKAFDDVVRKEKPVEVSLQLRKKLTVDKEKSKESLAQIYEKEYIRQRELLNDEVREENEPPIFNEIRTMQHELFCQLDALTSYFFTPTPAIPQLKIINKLPALNMEDPTPIAESEAAVLAPEEIKRKNKGDLKGDRENTKTDKKRQRRKKKAFQRKKFADDNIKKKQPTTK